MPSTRRAFLAAGAALAGVVGSAAAGGASGDGRRASAAQSPSSRGTAPFGLDPAGTRSDPDASGPRSGVEVAWTYDAPDWFLGTARPVLAGGVLYAVGNGLLALGRETGERRFGTPGPYRSGPALTGAEAYRTATLAVTAGRGVYGLDAGGGIGLPFVGDAVAAERWADARPTGGGELDFSFGPEGDPSPPVAADGTVYAPIPGTNALAALDASDGRERWRVVHHEDERVSGPFNRPAIRDGTVYGTAWPHQVFAVRADDGEVEWHREVDEQMVMPPAATEAGVVVQTREGVSLLDAEDGEPIWDRTLEANVTGSAPAVADGIVFAASEIESLYALDLETGETLWSVPFDGESSPVVADGVVYAVRSSFELVALDAATGERLFDYRPTEVPLSAPTVADGRLYAANRTRVLALTEP
ncbi:PQQ-binding-like beta-propeller repeat protein [Halomicrobium salinisoli]|uniref:outer membrane protein assembly factor BamB family protein n=1 Tax=Halomicrobium salinisoli TaxID=2878391 RepID=UPI001CEFD320|nr:PQQ-binding-like beta-propeller repeat protein [Halomicrobium salinisoli]